ncbi:uroporphyrinogen-III synthase [Rugosimonospora africana]|uniref:Uroporphyrinogen III methyltransferase n=1 Tax=Rugosimonospora africana TaxID=556532 RepID=A0A8J3VVX4_9ACTN|nr:uroporphyrinogen-III synthase [Rugosimonospora africana]GIH20785.1 uroporphyrinogen III methyltransferase [Rugosimonospora africana]
MAPPPRNALAAVAPLEAVAPARVEIPQERAGTHPPQAEQYGPAAMAGYAVAVVSDRRRHQLCDLLEAAGARTVAVQGVRTLSTFDSQPLQTPTAQVLAAPIDELVVASEFGFRSWLRLAREWRLADALSARFAGARRLASNPRAADALREIGLGEIWSTAAGSTEELFRYLMAQPMTGRRVVVQSDTPSVAELCHALRAAGADVVEAVTHQALPPTHADLLRRLGDQICAGAVDAVAFTNPASVDNLLAQAIADQRLNELLNAMSDEVPAMCLGELSAQPLRARGVPVRLPVQPFLEEFVALAAATVPERAVRVVASGMSLEIRGQAVVLNGELIPVQPGPIAVLRALARHPGRVISCAEIRRATPNWAGVDDHAIEMAVSRLRRSLRNNELIQTVMKRGYRLSG